MWLLLLPCVVFARHPVDAAQRLAMMFGAYVFFWFVLQELQRPGGMERMVGMLCATTMLVAVGLFIDYTFHVNLSLQGANLNQVTYIGNMSIWRAGGIFQDGQKAGAFLSAMLVFLLVLGVRGRFSGRGLRFLLWSAVLLGIPALFVTVSRAALFSFVPVCVLALVLANRWPPALKMFGIAMLVLLGAAFMFAPHSWMSLLPTALSERINQSSAEMQSRMAIWTDTWEMFAKHPFTGVGLGGFQQYLMDTRPTMSNYYGLGEIEGVAYVPDQPESGYFKVLYESGVLGSIAALVLAGATLRRAFGALLRESTSAEQRTELIAALAGLGVFATTFVTLFTLADPRLLAQMAFLMAVAWRPSIASSNPPPRA
jgi:O-antigen ligase